MYIGSTKRMHCLHYRVLQAFHLLCMIAVQLPPFILRATTTTPVWNPMFSLVNCTAWLGNGRVIVEIREKKLKTIASRVEKQLSDACF